MTNRIPQYDSDGNDRIDKIDLDTSTDSVWSHLDTVNKSPAPFDRSQITTVTDVSAGADADSTVSGVSSGEILVFPSGTFTWDSSVSIGSVSNWGIICQDDTFFEVPDGFGNVSSGNEYALDTQSGSTNNVLLENLTWTTPNDTDTAAPGIRLQVTNHAYVNGLEYDLDGPRTTDNQMNCIEPWVFGDDDGHIRVDDLVAHNNGDIGLYGGGTTRTGCYIGPANSGTVTLVRPVLSGFPNNGCYVSRTAPEGRVIIQDGLFMNNNVSGVRVGSKVEVYNSTFYVHEADYVSGDGANTGTTHNTRGAWFENRNDNDPNGGLVQRCSFIFPDVDFSAGCVVSSLNQWCYVRDCQFLVDTTEANFSGVVNSENTDIRMNVFNCTFDGTGAQTLGVGSGSITGRDNYYNSSHSPGSLPVVSDSNYAFDHGQTHPDTINRPALAGTVESPSEISFRRGLKTTDNGDGTVTVDAVDNPYKDLINHGVITAAGGSTPAVSTNVDLTGKREDETFVIVLRPRDPLSWNADYAFSYTWGHVWDDSAQHMDASIEVTWDTDPGSGNDLKIRWEARRL